MRNKKTNKLILVICIFLLIFIVEDIFGKILEAQVSKTHNVKVQGYLKLADGTEWPLIFEDGEYSRELIDEIVDDVNLIYSRFDKHVFISPNSARIFMLDGKAIKPEKYLSFSKNRDRYMPDQHFNNFGDLINIENTWNIVISKTLISEYEKALRFKKEHEDAFRKIDEDNDKDGLSNYEEVVLDTNSLDRDSDNDGFIDGYEVGYGSDPNDGSSMPTPSFYVDSTALEDGDGRPLLLLIRFKPLWTWHRIIISFD